MHIDQILIFCPLVLFVKTHSISYTQQLNKNFSKNFSTKYFSNFLHKSQAARRQRSLGGRFRGQAARAFFLSEVRVVESGTTPGRSINYLVRNYIKRSSIE